MHSDPPSTAVRAPAVILVEPQLGENIGAAARAMANFGLGDLRLVAPRDGWPSKKAKAAASGADGIIDAVRVFDFDGGGDRRPELRLCDKRPHPRSAEAGGRAARGGGGAAGAAPAPARRPGILFGRERWGLTNEEVALADAIVTFPVNPEIRLPQPRAGGAARLLRMDVGRARRRASGPLRHPGTRLHARRRRSICSG